MAPRFVHVNGDPIALIGERFFAAIQSVFECASSRELFDLGKEWVNHVLQLYTPRGLALWTLGAAAALAVSKRMFVYSKSRMILRKFGQTRLVKQHMK